jgi:hypothetical protein
MNNEAMAIYVGFCVLVGLLILLATNKYKKKVKNSKLKTFNICKRESLDKFFTIYDLPPSYIRSRRLWYAIEEILGDNWDNKNHSYEFDIINKDLLEIKETS